MQFFVEIILDAFPMCAYVLGVGGNTPIEIWIDKKKLETVIEMCCGHFAEDPKQLRLKPFTYEVRNKERLLFKEKVSQLCTTNTLN